MLQRYKHVGNVICVLCQLAISPNPKTADEPIIVHYDTRLTLKIEGVVQVSSHAKRFHHVQSVELAVHSTQQSRSPTLNGDSVVVCTAVNCFANSKLSYVQLVLKIWSKSVHGVLNQHTESALTLLVGRQEGHPASKKTGCWFVGGDILTGALHVL